MCGPVAVSLVRWTNHRRNVADDAVNRNKKSCNLNMKSTQPLYQRSSSPRRYRSPVSSRKCHHRSVRSPLFKRGGADKGDTVKVLDDEDDTVQGTLLRNLKRFVRNEGARYYQAVKEWNRLSTLEGVQLPDDGERWQRAIVRDRQTVGMLARQLLDATRMLVSHQVMMQLEASGLLVHDEARRRWTAIRFTRNGIVGRDDQNIDREKAELATAHVDVEGLFRTYLAEYPHVIEHMAL
jgi:hypothetical protein